MGAARGLQVILANCMRTVKVKKRNYIYQIYLKVPARGPQGECKGGARGCQVFCMPCMRIGREKKSQAGIEQDHAGL